MHDIRGQLLEDDALAYFYIDGTSEQLSDSAAVWRSILRQLARRSRGNTLVGKKWREDPRPPLDDHLVFALLRDALTMQMSRATTYILIDGIDEARNAHRVLAGAHGIFQFDAKIKLFLAGRPLRNLP